MLEAADRVLLQDEPEASALVTEKLIDDGIDLRLGVGHRQSPRAPMGLVVSIRWRAVGNGCATVGGLPAG